MTRNRALAVLMCGRYSNKIINPLYTLATKTWTALQCCLVLFQQGNLVRSVYTIRSSQYLNYKLKI